MPRKPYKYHYLYKTTNLINNKFYVGMHSTNDLNDGYLGSGKYLWNSINKHGKENFKCEILEFFDNRYDLKEKEKNYVNEKFIKDLLCMNLKPGGYGGICDEEHMIKFSKGGNDKIKWLLKNDKIWVDAKRQKQSESQKKSYFDGRIKNFNNKSFSGKTHKEESKDKIGKANSVKQSGEKNSQFGTCWIYKENINKKIKITELDFHLSCGWSKGRKMEN